MLERDGLILRELIAGEKGDDDPWDLKLARGALTDLDFIAQALTLAHAHAHPSLFGLASEAVFAEAGARGLVPEDDARALIEAHQLFGSIFQWQRLTIQGTFAVAQVSPTILKRLAATVGLPDAEILLTHLDATRAQVVEIYGRVLG